MMDERTAGAGLHAGLRFEAMQEAHLPQVLAIEEEVHAHPWTLGNFRDSLASGYPAWVLRTADTEQAPLAGYFLLMEALDEVHLLNVSLRRALHGSGLGRLMIDEAVRRMRARNMVSMLLEVRPSNERALHVYRRYGFAEIGRRKGYYPAAGHLREDAVVMRLPL